MSNWDVVLTVFGMTILYVGVTLLAGIFVGVTAKIFKYGFDLVGK